MYLSFVFSMKHKADNPRLIHLKLKEYKYILLYPLALVRCATLNYYRQLLWFSLQLIPHISLWLGVSLNYKDIKLSRFSLVSASRPKYHKLQSRYLFHYLNYDFK